MAYDRLNWKDHVVTKERTYSMVTNQDGTITLTPVPGEVIQQGTPQSATNFNHLEEAVQHESVALDMMYTILQAEMRDKDARIATLEAQLAALN